MSSSLSSSLSLHKFRFLVAVAIGSVHLVRAWLPLSKPSRLSFQSVLSAKAKQDDMLNFMNDPVDNTVGDDPPTVPPERDDLADMVRCIVRAADGRKADNIVALRVSPITTLTSFLVIVSGNSRPQNQAIAAAIQQDLLEEYDMRPGASGVPEGTPDSGWMLLDYGSVMVHVMTPKSRLYYNVEGQWRDKGGEYMDLSDVIIPNTLLQDKQLSDETSSTQDDEDPFWS